LHRAAALHKDPVSGRRWIVLTVRLARELQLFVASSRRGDEMTVTYDGTSSLGHVVTSLGVPLTEVGEHLVNGELVGPSYRPYDGDVLEVTPVVRPQAVPTDPARFLLDVHLGALARRMRLLGLDASYRNDADDDELVELAVAERRVLLSRDRGLLRRRAVSHGAYVRGDDPDDQLADVLDRFAPPLSPWTRCTACNGPLAPVAKGAVEARLEPGTRRSYDEFAQCGECGRVYWRGAHHSRLAVWVARFADA
jgi:uncharacterized protein with PIN domain